MIREATRKAWRAQALQAANGIDRGQDTYACIALAESDPSYPGYGPPDLVDLVCLFDDAFRPTEDERREYGMDPVAWLAQAGWDAEPLPLTADAEVRVLALLFFREFLGTPGALSGPDFCIQA